MDLAFCKRRINGKSLNHAQRFAAAVKAEQKSFRAFCKPKGINSVLAGDDKRNAGVYAIGNGEYARIKKINGEFQSELVNPPAPIAEEAPAAAEGSALVDVPAADFKSWVPLSAEGSAVNQCEECTNPVEVTENGFAALVCAACYQKTAPAPIEATI